MAQTDETTANDFAAGDAQDITYVKRKMAFICSKGNLDMAYPALIMAHAALNAGVHVDMFFTFWGMDLINKRTMDRLKFTVQANTATHLPALEKVLSRIRGYVYSSFNRYASGDDWFINLVHEK